MADAPLLEKFGLPEVFLAGLKDKDIPFCRTCGWSSFQVTSTSQVRAVVMGELPNTDVGVAAPISSRTTSLHCNRCGEVMVSNLRTAASLKANTAFRLACCTAEELSSALSLTRDHFGSGASYATLSGCVGIVAGFIVAIFGGAFMGVAGIVLSLLICVPLFGFLAFASVQSEHANDIRAIEQAIEQLPEMRFLFVAVAGGGACCFDRLKGSYASAPTLSPAGAIAAPWFPSLLTWSSDASCPSPSAVLPTC